MLERVPEKKALMVLNTSEMATAGDSGDTSVRPGVPRDVKHNAEATDGLESYSDPSRHKAVPSIRSDVDTCTEYSKQCNNDWRNALKYQFTPKQAETAQLTCRRENSVYRRCDGLGKRCGRRADVQSNKDDSKMTEQNRRMQHIRQQNSLGVHKIETLKHRGKRRHVNTYLLGTFAIA